MLCKITNKRLKSCRTVKRRNCAFLTCFSTLPNKCTKTNNTRLIHSLSCVSHANHFFSLSKLKDSSQQLTKAIDVNASVAKYYVARSRVRYLTDDGPGAQEDIIAAILINPLEDGCIDVLPRLFADTTLGDLLNSPMGRQVKEALVQRKVRLAVL